MNAEQKKILTQIKRTATVMDNHAAQIDCEALVLHEEATKVTDFLRSDNLYLANSDKNRELFFNGWTPTRIEKINKTIKLYKKNYNKLEQLKYLFWEAEDKV